MNDSMSVEHGHEPQAKIRKKRDPIAELMNSLYCAREVCDVCLNCARPVCTGQEIGCKAYQEKYKAEKKRRSLARTKKEGTKS